MPVINGKYKNPGWTNGSGTPVSAAELNAISDTLEKLDKSRSAAKQAEGK